MIKNTIYKKIIFPICIYCSSFYVAFSLSPELQEANKLYKNNNFIAAKKLYLQEKDKSPLASYMLGVLYIKGQGVKQNYTSALMYFQLAAEKDYPLAVFVLGTMYEQGLGVKKDFSKAFDLYKKIASESKLGKINIQGEMIPLNKVGLPEAQHNLATLYLKGQGTEKNISEAIKFYTMAAQKGYGESEYTLGVLYYSGTGVKKNQLKAKYYYQKAAIKGINKAQYNLAFIYLGEDKWERAEKWLMKAARNGLPQAQNDLAWYWSEKGINSKEALSFAIKAVSTCPNDSNYIDTLGWILLKQKKYDEALEQLKKASKLAPEDGAIRDHLGDVYSKLGKTKEGKDQWLKALELTKDAKLKKKIEEKLKDNKKDLLNPPSSGK